MGLKGVEKAWGWPFAWARKAAKTGRARPYDTREFGSAIDATTFLMPAATSCIATGADAALRVVLQGDAGSVASMTEWPWATAARSAMISAWEPPARWVWPWPSTIPSCVVKMQPTRGFRLVRKMPELARREAHSIIYLNGKFLFNFVKLNNVYVFW